MDNIKRMLPDIGVRGQSAALLGCGTIGKKLAEWFRNSGVEVTIYDIKPENIILDLCCGQGRHAIELTKRGFKVEGFDRSHYLIQRARSSAKKENINIRFKEGDARKLIYPADTFNIVMMLGNSFGYFETVKDDRRILKEISKTKNKILKIDFKDSKVTIEE